MSQNHVVEGEDNFEHDGPPPNEEGELVAQYYDAPEDGELISSNVVAHWDQEKSGPVRFSIQGVRLIDNSQTPSKSSGLLLCTLLAPAKLLVAGSKKDNQPGELKEYPAGTGFGIWAKPGMSSLQNLQGAHVWMAPNGYQKMKDEGKKSPMALFKVVRLKSSPMQGAPVTLIEDVRKESRKEPAIVKSPPWWLIVLGPDFGKAKASKQLMEELAAQASVS